MMNTKETAKVIVIITVTVLMKGASNKDLYLGIAVALIAPRQAVSTTNINANLPKIFLFALIRNDIL